MNENQLIISGKYFQCTLAIGLLSLLSIQGCDVAENQRISEPDFSEYLKLTQEERVQPENAIKSFETADGLNVLLFASEPMVVNPTNIDIDERGRVWVCESYNYAKPEDEITEEGGRIIILEDTDGDGKADKRTVFYQGEDVHAALGIAVFGNKVYVSKSPNLLVFTDENGDDIPDKKEKLFTGMGNPGDHSSHAVTFGPDGKLYWNMGNSGGPVMDSTGNQIKDLAGNDVIQNGDDYIGGMVFRCNLDGTGFEVIAHNFRNNYEVAVDSYGNLWQSDNDDDGNKACRINFVMEYGNYGYLDETSGESWFAHRTNLEEEIIDRHWHQNDPGVVPNMLMTGAGSPAGIMVYEGDLLPEIFQGEIIHVDAGPNVARAYPVEKFGAGYIAAIKNIVTTQYDQWFRPVDIAAAPDGSLFIADWYDPIVGGEAAGDFEKGRIFRVAPDISSYKVVSKDYISLDGLMEAIKSPNMATRYLAWTAISKLENEAEGHLMKLFEGSNPIYKARALWLLGKIPGQLEKYINLAIEDENPDIRIIGIRLARQSDIDLPAIAKSLINDPAPEVRREVALSLHLVTTEESADLWAELALQYDGKDRWYLEALGIAAANNWDMCMEKWLEKVGNNLDDGINRDIVWRSRSKRSSELLGNIISNPEITGSQRLRYFRAFDFLEGSRKQDILLALLEGDHPEQSNIRSLALQHIDPDKVAMNREIRNALVKTLSEVKGTREYLNLVDKYNLYDQKEEVLKLAMNAEERLAIDAARLLLDSERFDGKYLLESNLNATPDEALTVIRAVERVGNQQAFDLLSSFILDGTRSLDLRKRAVLGLGKSWSGEDALLTCIKNQDFDLELHSVAGSVLFNVYRTSIQDEASQLITRPESSGGYDLPPIRELIVSVGNINKGIEVFDMYCKTCHVVGRDGTDFGPQLSDIGNKLPKEGMYRAIVFPSEGISYGYEGSLITLRDGSSVMGIVENESDEYLDVRLIGGFRNRVSKSEIDKRENPPRSLMPNLSVSMSKEQLIDLVEYLSTLGKNEANL